MTSTVVIQVDLAGVGKKITAELEQIVDKAVGDLAVQAAKNWAAAIFATGLTDDEKNEYAKTLRIERIEPAHYAVVADYDKAGQIERGRPARDLKRMLLTSAKTRTSRHGKRYLIIPFRHNTPGNDAHAAAMPQAIYALASRLESSLVTGHRIDSGGVKRSTYLWPKEGRLPAGLAPKLQPHHKTDAFAGMRRFNTSAGKNSSSQYLMFRVMHQDSNGWVVKAKPGLHIAEGVASQLAETAGPYLQQSIIGGRD